MAEAQATTAEIVAAEAVRPLPARREPGTIELFGRQVPVAAAATAGAVAGVALIAARRASARPARRAPRRGLFRRRERIVARRSFLVDVHVLGR